MSQVMSAARFGVRKLGVDTGYITSACVNGDMASSGDNWEYEVSVNKAAIQIDRLTAYVWTQVSEADLATVV